MRPLSIYVTALMLRLNVTPMGATTLSIVLGLWGCWLIAWDSWVAGILLVNVWYLLDHVDGEIARYRGIVSPTGLYFDTLANVFIQPGTFTAIGWALYQSTGEMVWLFTGLIASYGLLMLAIIPFCESNVILQWLQGGKKAPFAPASDGPASAPPEKKAVVNDLFGRLHSTVAFPNILLVLSPVILLGQGTPDFFEPAIKALLTAYAVISTVIWSVVLTHQILSKKIDAKYEALKNELRSR